VLKEISLELYISKHTKYIWFENSLQPKN